MTGTPAPTGAVRARSRFAARLLVAQALVLAAGALTTWLVASVVGPSIFSDHLHQAGVAHTAEENRHVEEAFASALLISIALALVASVLAALAVSWYFSRRVQRSIGNVADAASQIASGRYDARVPDPGLGGEFATLASTYNRLAERLEATESTRRSMLADLAHEMRTPLATIEAHLEAVEDGVRTLDDTLDIVRGSTGRLRRLAEDMAAVSRAEEEGLDVTLRPIAAADVAAAAAEVARDRYAARGVQLYTDIADAGQVRVDADRIGQVLGNLLDNALRHTPDGGTVTLACRRVDDHWVEYRVADTGEGVATEHLPHLFDRFYRADTARDREHGGSGIGLAIAKALVEAHGGGISVTSPGPGHGTTFTLRLPGQR